MKTRSGEQRKKILRGYIYFLIIFIIFVVFVIYKLLIINDFDLFFPLRGFWRLLRAPMRFVNTV